MMVDDEFSEAIIRQVVDDLVHIATHLCVPLPNPHPVKRPTHVEMRSAIIAAMTKYRDAPASRLRSAPAGCRQSGEK